jgi:hypothetical protein
MSTPGGQVYIRGVVDAGEAVDGIGASACAKSRDAVRPRFLKAQSWTGNSIVECPVSFITGRRWPGRD